MNRTLKYALWATGGVAGLGLAAIAYLAITFDPNAYKPQIIEAVRTHKQRVLKLDGDIQLSFFPNLGAKLGGVALSEHGSDQPFASVDALQVSLAFLPLLRHQVVVNEVSVSGLRATLVRHADGTTNIDDLLSPEPSPPTPESPNRRPLAFDIQSVSVDKTTLAYRDEGRGAQYALRELSLKTGRIAPGVATPVQLSLGLQASQPAVDLQAQLKTELSADPAARKVQLRDLVLQLSGSAVGLTQLQFKASGQFDADLGTQTFGAQGVAFSASGLQGQAPFQLALQAPSLSLSPQRYAAGQITLDASLKAAAGELAAKLLVPGVEGDAKALRIAGLTLDADLKQPAQAFQLKLRSPVSGDLAAKRFALEDLAVALHARGEALPNKELRSEMKGRVDLDLAREQLQARLAGGLLQSQVKLGAEVHGFAAPAIRFDVDVDQFDADLLRPKSGATSAAPPESKPAAAEQPFDLTALRTLKLDGTVRVGALKAAKVQATQLRVGVRAQGGQLVLDPLAMNLYQGSAQLKATVDAAPATPSFALSGRLAGTQIAPLLKDLADLDLVEGKGNITLDLRTRGQRVSALKQGLDGRIAVSLADGAIRGVNLLKLTQGVQTLAATRTVQTLGLSKDEKTAFQACQASFALRDGVAHNEDLLVQAPLLRVTGRGDIDIGHDRLDYATQVSLSKTEGGGALTVPVALSGPFDALRYKVDYGAVVKDVVRQKAGAQIEQKKQELKDKAREELGSRLRGLFN